MGKITYKIDRLSNPALELGLGTGATLTGGLTNITTSKKLEYTSAPKTVDMSDNTLTHKLYVDDLTSAMETRIKTLIRGLITAGDEIDVEKASNEADPHFKISLSALKINSTALSGDHTYNATTVDKNGGTVIDTSKVVSGVKIDKFGRVIDLTYTTVSVANLDLTSNTQLDNYRQWNIKVGSGTTSTSNTFAVLSGNSSQTKTAQTAEDISSTSAIGLNLLAGTAINLAADTTNHTVTIAALLDESTITTAGDEGKIALKAVLSAAVAKGWYKTAYDVYGRLTSNEAVTAADVRGLSGINHSSSQNGLVNAKTTTNTTSAQESTYFYTSDGKWAQVPYEHVKSEAISTKVNLAATADDKSSTTVVRSTATIDKSGNIETSGSVTAGTFSGNGASITTLNASNISSGTISKDRLPLSDIRSDVLTNAFGTTYTNRAVITDANGKLTTLAQPTSADKYSVLTAKSDTAPHWETIDQLVGDIASSVVSQTGGFVFKGILSDSGATGTISPTDASFTTGYKKGYFYKVGSKLTITAEDKSTIVVEPGDSIYATRDYSATDKTMPWAALEQNLTDAVTFGGTANPITSGVLSIKTAGGTYLYDAMSATKTSNVWTITANISGSAATLTTERTFWGQKFNGSANVSGAMSNVGTITPTGTADIGTTSNKFTNAYFSGTVNAAKAILTDLKVTNTIDGTANSALSAKKVDAALKFTGLESEISYNGSEAKTIDLSAETLGFIKSFAAITAPSGTQNAIKSISITKADDGTATLTPTYVSLVDGVSSSIFNITGNNSKTIGFLTKATAGAFDTSTTTPTQTNRLNYNGYLYASNLYVGSTAVMKSVTATANTIILANGDGQVKSSAYTIDKNGAISNDNVILTSSGVHSAINSSIATTLKCATFTFTNTDKEGSEIPANSVIEHIDVRCDTAYSTNPAVTIKIGGANYVSSDELDLTSAGDVFTFKSCKTLSTAGKVSVAGLSTTATGSATVFVYYV